MKILNRSQISLISGAQSTAIDVKHLNMTRWEKSIWHPNDCEGDGCDLNYCASMGFKAPDGSSALVLRNFNAASLISRADELFKLNYTNFCFCGTNCTQGTQVHEEIFSDRNFGCPCD